MIIFQRGISYRADTNTRKKHQRGDKVLKLELSFLHATHRHDLFYTTVKYQQNISNDFYVIADTKIFTDGRQAHRYIPRTFPSGDKKQSKSKHGRNS